MVTIQHMYHKYQVMYDPLAGVISSDFERHLTRFQGHGFQK